jgi:hypothetical protein
MATTKTPRAPKPIPQHKDKLGRLIAIGDFVAYPAHNNLIFGKVTKLNNVMVKVVGIDNNRYGNSETNKYPCDVVRLEATDMTWYILKNS